MRIRDLREDNDYTQKYIAEKLGCSRSNYAMYENGDVKIGIEQLVKIADIYKVSIDYLVGLTDKKTFGIKCGKFTDEKLAYNLRKLRIEMKLDQSFLAKSVLNCTQSAYSQYEIGKRTN